MGREEAVSQIASVAREELHDVGEDVNPFMFQNMISICEHHDVDDRIDCIIDGMRVYMEQEIEQNLEEVRQHLEAFRGL